MTGIMIIISLLQLSLLCILLLHSHTLIFRCASRLSSVSYMFASKVYHFYHFYCLSYCWPSISDFLPSPRRLCFCQSLFVCMSVSKITQKVMDWSFWNFLGMSGMAKTISDSILGVIRKESWILDHFEIFVNIAFNGAYGKLLPNRIWCCHLANNMALAEVCGLWLLSSL